ncbi:MAG: hypothetical protein KR126chlam3_01025 [Chlamydiae bacterium]|nr:hypothetical protein [Chlamydiota bacterium]
MSFYTIGTTGWLPIPSLHNIHSTGIGEEIVERVFIKCDVNYSSSLNKQVLDLSTRVETASKVLGFPPALSGQITFNGNSVDSFPDNVILMILDAQRTGRLNVELTFVTDASSPMYNIKTILGV